MPNHGKRSSKTGNLGNLGNLGNMSVVVKAYSHLLSGGI